MLPREVLPGRFYMITRRATQRQLLLRPDAETNNIFLYVLAVAALRFGIVVLLPFVAGNHHHTIVYDPTGHGNPVPAARYRLRGTGCEGPARASRLPAGRQADRRAGALRGGRGSATVGSVRARPDASRSRDGSLP